MNKIFTSISILSLLFKTSFGIDNNADLLKTKYTVKVIAHRGASGYAPENTMSAIKKAIELGANYIEIDVHMSKDKEIVVIHDATLDRTTNHFGPVRNYTLAELKRFDAGVRFNEKFAGEKIPTLEEVIKETMGKAILLIEFKAGTSTYKGLETNTYEIIKRMKAEKWVETQTFYDEILNNWLSLNTNIAIHKLMVGKAWPFYIDTRLNAGNFISRAKGASGINPKVNFVRKKILSQVRLNNYTVYSWTANSDKEINKLLHYRVNGIISNYPDKVITLMKTWEKTE